VFTGIVEEVGEVQSVGELTLGINAVTVLSDLELGDSVAVNGVCLTVTAIDGAGFCVDVVPETRRKTNLGGLQVGALLNLERALTPESRMGGHIVQGHVEGVGTIESITPDGDAAIWRFSTDPAILRYVVPKGFIAIDGISLTVIEVDEQGFSVTLIPFTMEHTAMRSRGVGDTVNIETDVLGRYVERLLRRP
jgi:riboflavin synthase